MVSDLEQSVIMGVMHAGDEAYEDWVDERPLS